jgi:hypothetical protein
MFAPLTEYLLGNSLNKCIVFTGATMRVVKIAALIMILPAIMAAGCEQRYRYACQDPENWAEEYCQRPLCEVHRDCPDLIIEGLALSDEPAELRPAEQKKTGECK